MLLRYLSGILGLNPHVIGALRVNEEDGAKLAGPHAPGFHDLDFLGEAKVRDGLYQSPLQFQSASGLAS
jgi:hypothetical protein